MLKQMFASLALTVGLIPPSIASDLQQFPTTLVCVDQKGLTETITEFQELSFAGGVAMRYVPGVGLVKNNLVIFVNPTTQSWTIVERLSKELYCVVAVGEGFRLMTNNK